MVDLFFQKPFTTNCSEVTVQVIWPQIKMHILLLRSTYLYSEATFSIRL